MATFALVHGGQQGAWCFEPLSSELGRHGHSTVAIDLPIGDPTAGASEYADAVVASLAEIDEDVIIVGHSLGGLTLPLIAQRRRVRMLVFLCAMIPEPGTNPFDLIAEDVARFGSGTPNLLDEQAEWHLTPREEAREMFFPDCPREIQEWALDRQRPQCEKPHREITPLEEWPPIEVVVVNGARDLCIPIDRARRTAIRVFGRPPIELQDGHFPFLTNPGLIGDALAGIAAGERGAWEPVLAVATAPGGDGNRRAGRSRDA